MARHAWPGGKRRTLWNVVETQTELICRYLPDHATLRHDAYCRYFNKSRQELIGTRFIDLTPAHVRAEVRQHPVAHR